ncbi:hypothetical protein ACQ4PT_010665 [Festuca glaucescens]
MDAVFFGDLEPRYQPYSQPSCVAAAAETVVVDDSSSNGSGNSVVGANGEAGDVADPKACASLADAGEVSGCAAVSGWKRRHRVGKAPPERTLNSAHVTPLERTLREYPARPNGEVILPEVGVTFDSIGEAYDFYNLYSWERGFGVRHIDSYTKDLVKQMRENNVNLGKVYSTIGSFFGKMENVPFTKRALKTLCGKISSEQADDDVRKTIEVFSEMGAADPEFMYSVQVDDDSRIMNLLWTTGKGRAQYHYFGVLLREEKIENFEWVFREFVKMVSGKKPVTILTDQCRAMEVAIGNVLPATKHRWCKWHVLRKAKERLGALYGKNNQFKVDFHWIVNQMLTKEEFEGAWMQMLSASPRKVHGDSCPTCDEDVDSGRAGCFGASLGAVPEGPGADDIFQLQAFAAVPQLHGGGEARGCKR